MAISGGALGGIAAGVVVLIAGLIIGFVISRRIAMRKQKEMIAEYSAQLQMVRTCPNSS